MRSAAEVAAPDLLRRRSLGGPAARSLLLTVLGEFVLDHTEPVWNATLVRALEILGIREVTARQAVTRSAAEGWLERDRVGRQARWRLSAPTRELLVRGRERIYNFEGIATEWDGRWLMVVVRVPEGRRDHRHQVRTRLAWAGFGSLGGGLWISPHVEREADLSDAVAGNGVADVLSFHAEMGGMQEPRRVVEEAWDLREIADRYRDFVTRYRKLRPKDAEATFRAQTELVHDWRKFPFLDPDLPQEMLPERWPRTRAHQVFVERHAEWQGPAQAYFGSLERLVGAPADRAA